MKSASFRNAVLLLDLHLASFGVCVSFSYMLGVSHAASYTNFWRPLGNLMHFCSPAFRSRLFLGSLKGLVHGGVLLG